jgi:hypothetical protein
VLSGCMQNRISSASPFAKPLLRKRDHITLRGHACLGRWVCALRRVSSVLVRCCGVRPSRSRFRSVTSVRRTRARTRQRARFGLRHPALWAAIYASAQSSKVIAVAASSLCRALSALLGECVFAINPRLASLQRLLAGLGAPFRAPCPLP